MAPAADDCDLLVGPAGDVCRDDTTGGGAEAGTLDAPELDPLTAFAHSVADGAAWVVTRLSETVSGAAAVDFTNTTFLAQYAIVFAASTVLTLVLWLIAVAKRAVRGVSLTVAIGEAVGLLWLTVIASAFTPLVLFVTVGAVDSVTVAFSGESTSELFDSLAATLKAGGQEIGGGPLMLLITSAVTILVAGALWLVLVLRAAALFVGALLGAVVYAGLVDRSLWPKVRIWAGVMIALILVKPVVMISLSIASVFTREDGPGSAPVVVAGIAVIIVSLYASVAIFRFVPGYGDAISTGLAIRTAKIGGKVGMKTVGSAAGVISSGIQTHGGRSNSSGQGGKKGSSGVTDGMQAHGSRKSDPKK